ncbi:MAG TPA: DUF2339 domain-containing protein, partial [Kiloniellales bacterium]|nr:DUF2339 domain-containing protein [Kiloniellales bacterium]
MFDDSIIVPLLLALVAYLLVAPALGLRALVLVRQEHRALRLVRDELEVLRQQLAELRRTPGPGPEARVEPGPEPKTAPEPKHIEPEMPKATEPPKAPRPSPLPHRPRPGAGTAERAGSLEESLTSRWLVWLGAVTIALAGTFLVKYSIEQGWLGPSVRVTLGLLLGALLIAGGEALRRRPLARALAAVRPDYVPPALTAAGLFIAFASGYAAYGLYGLIGPGSAFLLLAGLAVLGVALALLQGPLIALLGLLGGYATPILVQTGTPAPWPLFGFLLALGASALAVAQLRNWWWLGWAALAGSALWPLLWFTAAWGPSDTLPLGLYLVLVSALFLAPALRPNGETAPLGPPRWFAAYGPADQLVWGAAAAFAAVAFAFLRMDAYQTGSLSVLVLLAALHLGLARKVARFDALAALASLLCLAVFATWHLPAILPPPPSLYVIAGRGYGSVPGPLLPPELISYAAWAGVFAALFGLGGLVALRGARRPGLFAAVSAATPFYLMAVAYWRFRDFEVDLAWAAVSLGLGGLALAAATWVARERERPGFGA